ncbi:MAG: methyltransferase domain-containing protein [Planctomycetota bacterium]
MASRGLAANRHLYDRFWKRMPVTPPQWFSTWSLVGAGRRRGRIVEIGPGTRPRAPLQSTLFLDLSLSALRKLARRGGRGSLADGGRLPLRRGSVDMVVAFDVLEHVERDGDLFEEIGRVLKGGGDFIFSVPLHPALFDRFDEVAGHLRRYEPSDLVDRLRAADFAVEAWSGFGSRPRSGWVNRAGAWWLENYPAWCAWTRDVLFRAVGRYFQGELPMRSEGLSRAAEDVAGVVVKARKRKP